MYAIIKQAMTCPLKEIPDNGHCLPCHWSWLALLIRVFRQLGFQYNWNGSKQRKKHIWSFH